MNFFTFVLFLVIYVFTASFFNYSTIDYAAQRGWGGVQGRYARSYGEKRG
jgi:hypothetical protein